MRRMAKKLIFLASLAALLLTATGCLFSASVSELYALPQMPVQYQELEAQINGLIAAGAEYAAPISGSNLQPVQMVDLDGDGTEEALVFLRRSAEEDPLKIYIFRLEQGSYRQLALLEGSGTAIYSISYVDLDGDDRQELLVGWRAGADSPALTVYTLRSGVPELLLSTTYSRYVFDSQGRGFVLLRSGPEEYCVAEAYELTESGVIQATSTARLSCTAAELAGGRVLSGTLKEKTPALFVVSLSADGSEAMTDVLRWDGEGLHNVTMSAATGHTTEAHPFRSIFPADINGDGVTELPVPEQAEEPGSSSGFVDWLSFDEQGDSERTAQTYHNRSDGWYLTIPEQWQGKLLVFRSDTGGYDAQVTFFWRDGAETRELFRIYAFTGENRELRATRGGRFRLRTQQHTVYAGELLSGAEELELNEETIRSLFSLIVTEWIGGEN